jgi:hypothetical protein
MHTKVEESHLKTEKMFFTLESFSSDKHHIEQRLDKMQEDIINHLVSKKTSDP